MLAFGQRRPRRRRARSRSRSRQGRRERLASSLARSACEADVHAARRPARGQHRVEDAVEPAAADQLRVPHRGLFGEAEPLRDGAAAAVADGGMDRHPMQPPDAEGVVDEGTDCGGRRPLPLVGRAEPVADRGRPVHPVDVVEAGDPGDLAVYQHRGLEAVAAGLLGARFGDELTGAGERLPGRPGHPPGELLAVLLDQRVDRLGVASASWSHGEAIARFRSGSERAAAQPPGTDRSPEHSAFSAKGGALRCRKVARGT